MKRLGLFNLTLIPRFDLMYTRILMRKIEKIRGLDEPHYFFNRKIKSNVKTLSFSTSILIEK